MKATENYREELLDRLRRPGYNLKYVRSALRDSKEAFLVSLHNVVDACIGMAKLASDTGLNRVNLYRMLSEEGNPRLDNLSAVLRRMGMRLSIEPILPDKESSGSERLPIK